MKLKNKKNLLIISIVFFILIIGILMLKSNILFNNILKIKKADNEAINDQIEIQLLKFDGNSGIILTKFRDDEDGIKKIEFLNDNNIIKCNGKKKVAVDYKVEKDNKYIIKMEKVNGEEITKELTIDNEYLYTNIVNYQEKKIEKGYKIVGFNYINGDKKNYYKIGENGEWIEYDNSNLFLYDYDLVHENLINDDETVTIYTKTVDKDENEIIVNKKYAVDTNATTTSITEDSLLQAASKEYFSTGIFKVSINDETYSLHVYEFDGNQIWDENMTFGTEKDVATKDENAKNMVVVKVKGNLTINEGVTVTSYASKDGYGSSKGMMLYIEGTLTNNGTIDMTARGAKAEGQNVYLWKNSDASYEYIPKLGGTGGKAKAFTAISGTDGNNRQTGGGASGSGMSRFDGTPQGGDGGDGTSYSGGAGGGGTSLYGGGTSTNRKSGSSIGGSGGDCYVERWL